MRDRFMEQLTQLHQELTNMGMRCVEAISCAIRALTENERELIAEAEQIEREIDGLESAIESLCVKLLLQQQPVAKDLRAITSALKMISDLERIGDQAADIAELTRRIIGRVNDSETHIKAMAVEAVKMVSDSIQSFVEGDENAARAVIRQDDVVDQYFMDIRDELVDLLKRHPDDSSYYLDLMMVAKYLERIGDHAANVAEWVIYSVTGIRESSEHHYK